MSQINVNRIKDSNKGAPDFPSGVNVGGITSTVTLGVTNLNPTNLNVSGVVTATTFDGSMSATGTPTLGLGVTINSSGINISGVATAGIVSATTLYGDGSNLTGIALSIAPLNYNPAVFGVDVGISQGIGITFNQAVKAGSGNVTLRLVGAAGTVVENFGVGNSVSYSNGDTISITPTADLEMNTVYHISYPSGAFTNIGGDVSYVGTGYTFDSVLILQQLWGIGPGHDGQGGQNNTVAYSSPVQLTGTTWKYASSNNDIVFASKTDGTLWVWGADNHGMVSQGNGKRSSPIQIPGTTWDKLSISGTTGNGAMGLIKTDGTLWTMGYNVYGQLGQNTAGNPASTNSPVQLAGTTWKQTAHGQYYFYATKTDGTLWAWGEGGEGQTGQNDRTQRSSPTQIPGTSWAWTVGTSGAIASKTDGTLWGWGGNGRGMLGQNNETEYSSPVQIPGTTWGTTEFKMASLYAGFAAIKTDGTLWVWGDNEYGALGLNGGANAHQSSPTQVPGTTWDSINESNNTVRAIKTDGTLWAWGRSNYGQVGQNNRTDYSSPVQVGSATDWVSGGQGNFQRRNA